MQLAKYGRASFKQVIYLSVVGTRGNQIIVEGIPIACQLSNATGGSDYSGLPVGVEDDSGVSPE